VWHDTKQEIRDAYGLEQHRAAIDARALQLTWLKTSEMATAFAG
jgi:hypothetical protein